MLVGLDLDVRAAAGEAPERNEGLREQRDPIGLGARLDRADDVAG